jgi:hypothetical protein
LNNEFLGFQLILINFELQRANLFTEHNPPRTSDDDDFTNFLALTDELQVGVKISQAGSLDEKRAGVWSSCRLGDECADPEKKIR